MKRTFGIIGTIGLALGTLAFVVPTAGATPAATLTVNPSGGLSGGSVVKISGAHYPKSTTLYAVECLKTSTSEAGCDIATAKAEATTKSGKLPKGATFTVASGVIGTGTCGTSKTDKSACAIVIGSISGTDYAAAAITFKVPKVAA